MNIFQNQYSLLNSIFRSVPLTLPTCIFIYYYLYRNIQIFYLFCGTLIINFLCIPISKYLFIKLDNYLSTIYNITEYPFIGRFKRPDNAINTGCFYISDTNYTTTSGMPSGHCMLTAFTCMYLYYYLIYDYKTPKNNQNILIIILTIIIIYMAYTRVLMNCHTIQQTILGSFMGLLFGHFYYFYIKNKI